MEDLKKFMSTVYDTMTGIPTDCYSEMESVWNIIQEKLQQGGKANIEETTIVRGAQVDVVSLESTQEDWVGRIEVSTAADKKRLVFSQVQKIDGTLATSNVEALAMDFDVVDGEVLLNRMDSVSGKVKPYEDMCEESTKYQFDLTFVKTERNPGSKENYLEKTKREFKYIRYGEKKAALLLNRVAQALCRIFIWGAPNENITNIRPLRMVNGHLGEVVFQEEENPHGLLYTGYSRGSFVNRDLTLRILNNKKGTQK